MAWNKVIRIDEICDRDADTARGDDLPVTIDLRHALVSCALRTRERSTRFQCATRLTAGLARPPQPPQDT
jgi:hypothetical protein